MSVYLLVVFVLLVLALRRSEAFTQADSAEGAFDVYLINMARNPARLAHFKRTFGRSDLADRSFTRFEGIDGSRLDLEPLVTPKAMREITSAEKDGYRTRHYQLTRGAVGCAMSHLGVWRALLDSDKEMAFVFEDDAMLDPHLLARFRRNAPRLPPDWDVLLLGYFCNRCLRRPGYKRVVRFYGLHGYVIRRKAAARLVPLVLPVGQQVDSLMSDLAEQGLLSVVCFDEKYVMQNNRAFRTEIQVPLRTVAGEDPWTTLPEDLLSYPVMSGPANCRPRLPAPQIRFSAQPSLS